MKCPDENIQQHYLRTLDSDIQKFISEHPNIVLHGFDIGGGTPTALSEGNFSLLMDIYHKTISNVNISSDFEPSIEGSFQTLSENKLRMISKVGIRRLSLGIQSTNKEVLSANQHSIPSTDIFIEWIKYAKCVGIHKVNLDFMYGLKAQTQNAIKSEISILDLLKTEQITLYELRPNILGINSFMSKEDLFQSYNILYDDLTSKCYNARFGQNTFSVNEDDFGVSSYLRKRMLDGVSYNGFGIAAQSMSKFGISYTVGKNSVNPSQYINLEAYAEEYSYQLPKSELLSKYIAISAYSGRISLKRASEIICDDCFGYFKPQIEFCIEHDLMTLEDNTLYISSKGFKNYGAVFSLFYKSHKNDF